MIIKIVDAFIQPDQYVTVTDMGKIIEVQYLSRKNASANIKKISKTEYIDLATGEQKEFSLSENRGDNLNSLRQTFKKLAYLVNGNFSGGKNELWTTLTYAENITDLVTVRTDFDKFIKRLKYYTSKRFQDKGNFEFIKVLEPQERGAWHMHVLIKFPNLKSIYIPNEELSALWSHGFVDIKRIEQTDNLGAYLCAYLTNVVVDDIDASNLDANTLKANNIGVSKSENLPVYKDRRLHLYPVGMNIYSRSKGIQYPQRKIMQYSKVKDKLGFKPNNLTLRKSLRLSSKGRDFENTVIVEQYNKQVNNSDNLLSKISFFKSCLAKTVDDTMRKRLEEIIYTYEHHFELQELKKAEFRDKQLHEQNEIPPSIF